MANNVNPPPQLQIPRQFLSDPEARAFFDQQRTILFQLWQKLGGNSDPIEALKNDNGQSLNSISQFLLKNSSGRPQFTIDSSGFTIDASYITTDKATA